MQEGRLHVFSGQLILRVSVPRDRLISNVSILRDGKLVASSADHSAAILLEHVSRNFRRQYVDHTFIADLSALGGDEVFSWLQQLELVCETDGELYREAVQLEPGDAQLLPGLPTPALRQLLTRRSHLARVLRADAEAAPGDTIQSHPMHFEFSAASGGLLLIQGWCANAASCGLQFYIGGLSCSSEGTIAFAPRPDVSSYLREQGVEVLNDMHGFVATMSTPFLSTLRAYIERDRSLYMIFNEQLKLKNTTQDAVGRLVALWRGGVFGWDQSLRSMAAFLQPAPPSPDAFQVCISAASSSPRLSVVVPFYREWRFAFSIAHMIAKSPPDWEWVLVCDDNGIHPRLFDFVRDQTASVRERVTYVRTLANLGYGLSNNIGVRVARADSVLLMNSDIWIENFDAIDEALASMRAIDPKITGFRLLFEDETIQHDGIEFEESNELNSRVICVHKRKGIPVHLLETQPIRDKSVKAVTGALMLMPKTMYQSLGGFSKAYIGGDFEDADLCLQARAAGASVEIVRAPGVYHLERQSIRHDAADSVAFARTLVNCERFNSRWFADQPRHDLVSG